MLLLPTARQASNVDTIPAAEGLSKLFSLLLIT